MYNRYYWQVFLFSMRRFEDENDDDVYEDMNGIRHLYKFVEKLTYLVSCGN